MFDKSKLPALVKRETAAPPADLLRRIAAKGAAPAVTNPNDGFIQPAAARKPAPKRGREEEVSLAELVEEAAQEAEAQADQEFEGLFPEMYRDPTKAPPWAKDAEKWQAALDAVGVGTPDEDRYDEPLAVAAYLYRKIGGEVEGMEVETGEVEEAGEAKEPGEHGEAPEGEGAAVKAVEPGAVRGMAGKLAMAKQAAKPPAPKPPTPPAAKPEGKPAPPAQVSTADAAKEPVADADAAAEQVKGNPESPNSMWAKGYDPERDGNPPSWVADEATWEKAKKAVEPKWGDYDEPWAVVATVYENMGGKKK